MLVIAGSNQPSSGGRLIAIDDRKLRKDSWSFKGAAEGPARKIAGCARRLSIAAWLAAALYDATLSLFFGRMRLEGELRKGQNCLAKE